jgi:hypothetical protein
MLTALGWEVVLWNGKYPAEKARMATTIIETTQGHVLLDTLPSVGCLFSVIVLHLNHII